MDTATRSKTPDFCQRAKASSRNNNQSSQLMSRTRIVAVDDDRRILRVLKRACETVGYEVHSVLDAEFFESSFRVFEPSLVFLDLSMNNIDGIELLRFIAKERRETAVVVTSGVDERLLGAAHSFGMSLGLRMLEPIRKPLIVADVRRRLKMFRDQPTVIPPAIVSASDLKQALTDGLLEVYYQPMVNLTTREVVCIEALARLRKPGSGVHLPEQFIPIAEQSGLIDALTFGVLDRALTDVAALQVQSPKLQVAVNVSPVMLSDVDLPDRIESSLSAHQVSPGQLVIEVTETSAPDDRQRMADTLSRLRLKGIRLALDDFGTGYCSLGQLYEFPYETLKLDKKFAMRAESNSNAAAMIRSSLELARSVGLTVVAEGIQSEETMRWLDRLGCDVGQGFHISPPLTLYALTDWLRDPEQTISTAMSSPTSAAVLR
ncbi:MAG: EAL domain-containing protein (putative c-di-GMP-specific phosphodiesterase class I)/ActR [Gammaproteobacteria bacterium]|jgi:EAL domain-containing protein (putative c-di-GMP-specific phosphodiesterase class I)/ActR/RegA family two-component response regulator